MTKRIPPKKILPAWIIPAFILTFSQIHAQLPEHTFTGKVTDTNNRPLEFATAALYSTDSALVGGSVTDHTGTFRVGHMKVGHYTLEVRLIGYETVRRTVDFRSSNTDAGTIILTETGVGLNEVTVTADRPVITRRNGMLTTTVAGTMLAKEHTLSDVLGKIPGIINNQGSIEVFGSGTPIYYINNRLVRNNAELGMLDVKNIRKIELLSNPGAKYGSGVTSVIKIYTLRRASGLSLKAGASGSMSEKFSHGANLTLGYKTEKLSASAYYSYYDYHNRSHQYLVKGIEADTARKYTTDSRQLPSYLSHNYQFSVDYLIRSGQVVGGQLIGSHSDSRVLSDDRNTVEINNLITERFDSPNKMKQADDDVQINLFYNADWTDHLSTSLNLDYVGDRANKNQTVHEIMVHDTSLTDSRLRSNYDIYAAELTADLNFSESSSLSLGAEFSRIDGHGSHAVYAGGLPESHYKSSEDRCAGYAEYSHTLGAWSLNAGLRYERVGRSHTDLIDPLNNLRDVDAKLFPSASITYANDRFNTSLTFSTKTSRPALSYLNSRTYYQSRFVYQKGNPKLKAETSYNLEWSLGWRWINLRASYTRTNDYLTSTLVDDPSMPNVIVNTWQNFPKAESLLVGIDLRHTFGPWSPSISAGFVKPRLTGVYLGEAVDYNEASYYVQSNHYVNLLAGIVANLDFYYNSGGNQGIYHFDPYWSLGAGLRKSFLSDRLDVRLSASDIFHTLDYYERARINRFNFYQNEYYAQWNFSLSLIYRFNTQQLKYRGHSAAQQEKRRL